MLEKKEVYYCETCHNSIPKGKFCPDCGVHNKGEKATFKSLFTNSISEVFSVEKGLIHNFKITFSKPHDIVWSYFNGIRNKYAAPGKFLLYTLFLLGAIYLINPNISALNISVQGESTNALTGSKLFLIFILPILSISSKIVFWKNKGIAIHIISMVYIFLPRFVIVSIVMIIINTAPGHHWSQPLIILILLSNTFWTNTIVQRNNSSILQKISFTVLQFIALLAMIVLIIAGSILIGDFSFSVQ